MFETTNQLHITSHQSFHSIKHSINTIKPPKKSTEISLLESPSKPQQTIHSKITINNSTFAIHPFHNQKSPTFFALFFANNISDPTNGRSSGSDLLEVPIPYIFGLYVFQAYVRGYPSRTAKNMVLTYLHLLVITGYNWLFLWDYTFYQWGFSTYNILSLV